MSNVMRRAPPYMEEIVKVMRDGIASSYVGDLRRRRAPSHVVEVMRAMRGCAELVVGRSRSRKIHRRLRGLLFIQT